MQKNQFLLLKKLENAESAQLWPDLGLPLKRGALLSGIWSRLVFSEKAPPRGLIITNYRPLPIFIWQNVPNGE